MEASSRFHEIGLFVPQMPPNDVWVDENSDLVLVALTLCPPRLRIAQSDAATDAMA